MKLININPCVRFARLHKSICTDTKKRLCYDCRLFLIKKGKGVIKAQKESYQVSAGSVVFLPPATVYSFDEIEKNTEIYVLNFDLVDKYTNFKHSLGTPYFGAHNESKILSYPMPKEFEKPIVKKCTKILKSAEKICEYFLVQKPYYRELSSAALKEALITFLQHEDEQSSYGVVNEVLSYIYQNFDSAELNNTTIAEHFGYHPYYLISLVKKVTGKTLHRQISDYRVSVAIDLLINTEYDINTIAWKCGFSSVSYFINSFKSKIGVTPKQYRKDIRIV